MAGPASRGKAKTSRVATRERIETEKRNAIYSHRWEGEGERQRVALAAVEGDFDAVLGGSGDAGVELQGHLAGAQLEAETAQDVRQHQLGLDDRKPLPNAVRVAFVRR